MESLKWIQQIVFRDFSNLEANIISTSEILHVFRLKKDQKGLKYLPNFHVIFQAHKDNLTVRLVTFHGKTVDSLVFKKTENDEDIPDHIKDFMDKYSSEEMQLCQGIKRDDALNPIEEHLKVSPSASKKMLNKVFFCQKGPHKRQRSKKHSK